MIIFVFPAYVYDVTFQKSAKATRQELQISSTARVLYVKAELVPCLNWHMIVELLAQDINSSSPFFMNGELTNNMHFVQSA